MKTFLLLPRTHERRIPQKFAGDDNRFPEALVRHFLKKFTCSGDKVLDPFAGLGTTGYVCETLGRIPFGVEADPARHQWIIATAKQPDHFVLGDAVGLQSFAFPRCDFCITSPPYMPRQHRWNPLFQGNPREAGYPKYLARLEEIFRQVSLVVKRNGYLVIEVHNLKGKEVTPLAWDIASRVSTIMKFEGEIITGWNGLAFAGYNHSYCLIFKNTKPPKLGTRR